MSRRIVIDLTDAESAAFDMLRAGCALSDPDPERTPERFAADLIRSVLEDDLAAHRSEPKLAH